MPLLRRTAPVDAPPIGMATPLPIADPECKLNSLKFAAALLMLIQSAGTPAAAAEDPLLNDGECCAEFDGPG